MTGRPLTWVVGAGGLLGGAVVDLVTRSGEPVWRPLQPIVWGRPDTPEQMGRAAEAFLSHAEDIPWQVAWCAGAGVTSTGSSALEAEIAVFDALMATLARSRNPNQGALFLASSAGGVYAGAPAPPHDELTEPSAIAPYGHAKLQMEERAGRLAAGVGVPVLVGRISNLYGPGQNLEKPQGLISHIARALLLRRPVSIYVPLDTLRDYLYVDDAARLVVDGLVRLRSESAQEPQSVTKIIASHQSVSVGYLISEFGRVLKRRPQVVYGASGAAAYQSRDLRLRSRVWTELDTEPFVPIPVGIRRTLDALARSARAGALR